MARSADLLKKAIREATARWGGVAQLARRMGVKPPQIHKTLLPDSNPTLDTLDRFAAAILRTPAEIISEPETPAIVDALRGQLRARDEEILKLKVTQIEARRAYFRAAPARLIPENLARRFATLPKSRRQFALKRFEEAVIAPPSEVKASRALDKTPNSPTTPLPEIPPDILQAIRENPPDKETWVAVKQALSAQAKDRAKAKKPVK